MKLSDFEAIIFDSDGVLVDSEVIHVAVERELLADMGLHYGKEDYLARFVGLSNPDFYRALAADYLTETGQAFPSDFGQELQARIWPRIEAELQPLADIEPLVKGFKGKVGVGSSAPFDRLTRKLEITGLHLLFAPHIYSADHVSKGKPAPDLFLHVAKQLRVEPTRCAVIEDSVHGIKAARAARMAPIGFCGGGHADAGLEERLREAGATFVTASHAELRKLL